MRFRRLLPLVTLSILAAPAAASAAFVHTVLPGESLTSVAAADGLTVSQLATANGLSLESELIAGSTLVIPSLQGEEEAVSASSTQGGGVYLVQPGDTLSAIAARAGVSVTELAAANGLDPTGVLLAGTTIDLPGAEGAGVSTSSSSTGPYPTPETVTPSEVGSIAATDGVPASLAEAVADQESGFNNDFISAAGASGVMQITPETWSWIGSELAGPPPLAPASAPDNVRGGVLLLHSLLGATGQDQGLAVAGYYQGLSSVLENGEYPETQQYVSDVMALQQQFGGE